MALYQLDGRGPHYDDLRAGAIASMVANIHRNRKVAPAPFDELAFIPWNEHHRLVADRAAEAAAAIVADPEAHSRLLDAMLFPRRE